MSTESSTSAGSGRQALLVVVAATALIVIDTTIMGVAIPAIAESWGTGLVALQWVVIGYAVTFGAVILPIGSLSDRVGHRRLFIVGVAIFTVASAGCAVSPNIELLNVFRTVQGAGAGMIFATAVPLVSAATDAIERPRALALWAAAAGSFSAVGPLLGGVLVALVNWQAIFAVNIPLGLLALILAGRWLPADPHTSDARVRPAELSVAAAITIALLGIFYVLNTARQEWNTSKTAIGIAAVALLAATLFAQGRLARPLVDPTLLRVRRYAGAATLSMLSRFTTMAPPVFLVIYLQQGLGAGPFTAGVTLVPMFVAAFTGGMLARRAQSEYSVGALAAAGFGTAAAGSALTAAVLGPATAAVVVAMVLIPVGFGFGLASTPLIAVAVAAAPPERTGMAAGLANCLVPMGTAAGTALLGVLFAAEPMMPDLAHAASRVMAAAAAVGLAATALALWSLPDREPNPVMQRQDS